MFYIKEGFHLIPILLIIVIVILLIKHCILLRKGPNIRKKVYLLEVFNQKTAPGAGGAPI